MLPRVSAALAQFIRPIASAGKQTTVERRPNREFERFPKQQEQPHLKLVEPPTESPSDTESAQPPAPTQKSPGHLSVTQTFLQLVHSIHQNRSLLFKWIGNYAYMKAHRDRRKSAKFRKGAMLDTKAE